MASRSEWEDVVNQLWQDDFLCRDSGEQRERKLLMKMKIEKSLTKSSEFKLLLWALLMVRIDWLQYRIDVYFDIKIIKQQKHFNVLWRA